MKIALVGPSPDAVGGVSASVQNLRRALDSRKDVQVIYFTWREIWKAPFFRPDVIHFNFSKPWKRFFGAALGRLVGASVVHTIHGSGFRIESSFNRAALSLSHGVVVLNEKVHARFKGELRYKKAIARFSSVFAEGVLPVNQASINGIRSQFEWDGSVRYLLVYAHSDSVKNGSETYGFRFISQCLSRLNEMGLGVVFLDVNRSYNQEEINPRKLKNVIYIDRPVDFKAICCIVDLYVRPTSTDGDSVAVIEALDVGLPVVASDVVPRPDGVLTYRFLDEDDFLLNVKRVIGADGLKAEARGLRASSISSVDEYLLFLRSIVEL